MKTEMYLIGHTLGVAARQLEEVQESFDLPHPTWLVLKDIRAQVEEASYAQDIAHWGDLVRGYEDGYAKV